MTEQDPVEAITGGVHVNLSAGSTLDDLETVTLAEHLTSLVDDVRRSGPPSRNRSLAITALEEAAWRLSQAETEDNKGEASD